MAGSFGDYAEAAVLNTVFGATAFPTIATHYVALYTVIPTDVNAGGTEVTGGSYARVAVTNSRSLVTSVVALATRAKTTQRVKARVMMTLAMLGPRTEAIRMARRMEGNANWISASRMMTVSSHLPKYPATRPSDSRAAERSSPSRAVHGAEASVT